MPRYIGEGPREMYWQDGMGKWHHACGKGKSFDTMEDAKADYDSQGHVGVIDTPIGFVAFVGLIVLLKLLGGQ